MRYPQLRTLEPFCPRRGVAGSAKNIVKEVLQARGRLDDIRGDKTHGIVAGRNMEGRRKVV